MSTIEDTIQVCCDHGFIILAGFLSSYAATWIVDKAGRTGPAALGELVSTLTLSFSFGSLTFFRSLSLIQDSHCLHGTTTFDLERSPSLVRSNRLTLPSPTTRSFPLATLPTRFHPPSSSRPVNWFGQTSPTGRPPKRPRSHSVAIRRSRRLIKTPNWRRRSTTLHSSARASSLPRRRTRRRPSPIFFVCSCSFAVRCAYFPSPQRIADVELFSLVSVSGMDFAAIALLDSSGSGLRLRGAGEQQNF
jgi:hypothetical protein